MWAGGSAPEREPSVTERSHREKASYSEREYHHEGQEGHKVKLACEILRDLRVLRGRQVFYRVTGAESPAGGKAPWLPPAHTLGQGAASTWPASHLLKGLTVALFGPRDSWCFVSIGRRKVDKFLPPGLLYESNSRIKLYRIRGLNPRVRPNRQSMGGELPLLPFQNPIGFVPASRGGVYIELIRLI